LYTAEIKDMTEELAVQNNESTPVQDGPAKSEQIKSTTVTEIQCPQQQEQKNLQKYRMQMETFKQKPLDTKNSCRIKSADRWYRKITLINTTNACEYC
jgi:hypothetical protein